MAILSSDPAKDAWPTTNKSGIMVSHSLDTAQDPAQDKAVTVQVVTTGITPQLATSERLREAETEPRHHVEPRHTPR